MNSIFKKTSILLFLLLWSTHISAQGIKEGYNLNNPFFLDSTLDDFNVFLTAEMHWRKENTPRKEKMIEYLASRNSIDVIVVERSYDFGHWVNYFLETGDSLFLKEFLNIDNFFSTKNGVVYDDEYAFYLWLRRFNLNNNLSIRVIGIDLRGLWNEKPGLWSFLKFIQRNPELQKPLEKSIVKAERFMKKNNVSGFTMVKWLRKLTATAANIEINDKSFSNYIFNLNQSIPWTFKNDLDYRDGEIAKNFKRYIEKDQKVYGQFGIDHIALKKGERIGFNSFASILNRDEYYKGKILSIGIVCFNCDNFGNFAGPDLYAHLLTDEEFKRLKPKLLVLPPNTFIDLRNTDEKIKDYCQLLLVEFD